MRWVFTGLLITGFVVACGQKGPLELPQPQPAHTAALLVSR